MLHKNEIPKMTHPLSSGWQQPSRSDILVDCEYAYMTQHTMNQLPTYSATLPTGVYEGKMWKSKYDKWYLNWFAESPKDADMCRGEVRIIKVVDELWMSTPVEKLSDVLPPMQGTKK